MSTSIAAGLVISGSLANSETSMLGARLERLQFVARAKAAPRAVVHETNDQAPTSEANREQQASMDGTFRQGVQLGGGSQGSDRAAVV